MSIYVKCKTEGCGADVQAAQYAQVPKDKLPEVLHKKNYYLCPKCGRVNPYVLDDHLES